MAGYIDRRTGAGSFHIPDAESLDFFTYLHAAHTFDTFGRITYKGKLLIPWLSLQLCLIWNVKDVQVIRNLLEAAVSAPCTAYTLAVVLGKDQLYRRPPVTAYFRAVRIDDHALFSHVITGCDQLFFAFQFDYTYTACRDLIDPLQITQLGDRDPVLGGSLHNGSILFY